MAKRSHLCLLVGYLSIYQISRFFKQTHRLPVEPTTKQSSLTDSSGSGPLLEGNDPTQPPSRTTHSNVSPTRTCLQSLLLFQPRSPWEVRSSRERKYWPSSYPSSFPCLSSGRREASEPLTPSLSFRATPSHVSTSKSSSPSYPSPWRVG